LEEKAFFVMITNMMVELVGASEPDSLTKDIGMMKMFFTVIEWSIGLVTERLIGMSAIIPAFVLSQL
jgi:hypothetical protein